MIRRALLATINYDHPQRGMEHAFQSLLGKQNVWSFDYYELQRQGMKNGEINAQFLETVRNFKPDWVWMQLQDSGIILADTIRLARKLAPQAVFTHWTGDLRPTVSDYLSSICKATHMTLISSVGQIPLFQKAGAETVAYCQVALDWEEDVMGTQYVEPSFRVPDVLFMGNNYGKVYEQGTYERESAIITLMRAGIDVGILGRGWRSDFPVLGECKLKEQVHLWRKAKVALNVNHFNDVELYYSDRQLVSMVSGTPLVCRAIPGLEYEFQHRRHLMSFGTEPELVRHVEELLKHEWLRKEIGSAGRAKVLAEHTWFNRITGVWESVERIQGTL